MLLMHSASGPGASHSASCQEWGMGTGYESQARVAWGTGCPPTVDTETVVRQARGDTSDCCSPGPLAGQSPGWPAGRQCALLVMGVDLQPGQPWYEHWLAAH